MLAPVLAIALCCQTQAAPHAEAVALLTDRPLVERQTVPDLLLIVRETNRLIGAKKGWVHDFVRTMTDRDREQRLGFDFFWVANLYFDVPEKPGYFSPPRIGAIFPNPPKDLTLAPRYPLIVAQDVPFCAMQGFALGGEAERGTMYFDRLAISAEPRKQPLVPADDPFAVYENLVKTKQLENSSASLSIGLKQILTLVRQAYKPVTPPEYIDQALFDKLHREFLSYHIYWDAEHQSYVRGKPDPRR